MSDVALRPTLSASPACPAASWMAIALAWMVGLASRLGAWPDLGLRFNDTDDAMRLVQVRDLLAGQGWYDLVQHRLDPAFPIPMHWSRLVDAPVAALMLLFGRFAEPAVAERLAMTAWPALTLLAALVAVQAIARRLGGERAALAVLALLGLGVSALWQFAPGRIDHHNLQVALGLTMFAALLTPTARGWARAGLASALMLAVGLETLPLLAPAVLAVAAAYVWNPASRRAAFAYGASFAGAVVALAALTVPPTAWIRGACDSLSLGYVALAVAGGGGLAWAASRERSIGSRVASLGVAAVVGLAAFAWVEPACVRGPFGQVDPRLWPIWLNLVEELRSWPAVSRLDPTSGALLIVTPAMGVFATALLLRAPARRSPAILAFVAAFAISLLIGVAQIRTLFYANMLAMPLVAAAIAELAARAASRGRSALSVMLAGCVIANTTTFAIAAALFGPEPPSLVPGAADGRACFDLQDYAALPKVAPGLVAGTLDLGPFVLAGTPHAVLSAPYHRQGRGIVDGDAILNARPAEAAAMLRARGAAYVLLCSRSPHLERYVRLAPEGLAARLARGESVPGLEPLATDGLLRFYRVAAP